MTSLDQPPQAPEPDLASSGQIAQAAQQQLPQTGVQQQVASVNAQQVPAAPQQGVAAMQPQPGGAGVTSLGNLAQRLAQSYGLPIGRGGLVDEQGNFLMTPEQLAQASGGAETMGSAAAKMNYIAQAVAAEQNRQQQQKGVAALQTGLGLVQSRGRGSLAAMQSGFYQDLADMYSNQEYDAADFSYFIQKEQLDIERAIARDLRKAAEKKSLGAGIGGVLGAVVGGITGIPGLSQAGAALGGAAGGSWF